jgi:hypothetical protein
MSSQTSEPEHDTAQNTPVDVKEPYDEKDDAIERLRLAQKAFHDGHIAGQRKGAEDGIVVGMAVGAVAVTVLLGGWWLYSSFDGKISQQQSSSQ